MLSKQEVLKSLMGKEVHISPGCVGITIEVDGRSVELCSKITQVGEDMFEAILIKFNIRSLYSISHLVEVKYN